MSNVRAEVLRVSRSRSGWRDGSQKPSSQRPFISALKSTFEGDKQKGDVTGTGTGTGAIMGASKPDGGGSGIVRSASDGGSGAGANVKPHRLGGTKVSSIANMFQSLTPSTTPTATTPTSLQQKEYEDPAMYSRPSSKMESTSKRDRREASSPCSSSSSSSSSLTTEKCKADRGGRDRGDGSVHLNRTESHLARFNNARAMFERLEEESKKSKAPCGWSPAVPKKRSGSMSPSRPSSAISPPQTPRSPSPKRDSPLSPREKSRSADCILEDRPSTGSKTCRNGSSGRRQLFDDHHEDDFCLRVDHNEETSQSPVLASEAGGEQRTVNGTLEREERASSDGEVLAAPAPATVAEVKQRPSVSSPQTRSTKIPIPQAAQQLAETNVAISSSRSRSAEDKMTKSHIPHLQRAPYSPKTSASSSIIPDSTVTSAVVVNNVPKVHDLVSKGTTTTKPTSTLPEDTVDLNGHGSGICVGEVDAVASLQQNGAKDSKSNDVRWDHDDDASRTVHIRKEEREPEDEDLLRITEGSIEVVYADHQTSNSSWTGATIAVQAPTPQSHVILQARRSWDRTPNTLDLGCFADEGTRVDPDEDEIENTETPALPTPPTNGPLRDGEDSRNTANDEEGEVAAKCSVLQDEAAENVTSAAIQYGNDVPTQAHAFESTTVQPKLPDAPRSSLEQALEPEVMTPEEASRLLSRNWRPEFLSDEEASEVTMLLRSQQEAQNEALLLQNQVRHQSDSEAGDIETEPTEAYEYEAEFEESVEEAEPEAEAEAEPEQEVERQEGEVEEGEEGVHYLEDGHFWVEMPGLVASDEEDVDPFVAPITRPKKRERVKFSTDPIRVYSTFSVQDYDRRNDDVDPVSASAEYELEKRVEKMDVFPVELVKGPEGLGLSIIGMGVGADAGLEKLGIFVKTITEGGAAFKDGRINVNDQIIEVDGKSLVGVTQAYAASVLRNTSGLVRFLIGREKDGENSEVAQLISQSLQADREREERRKALDSPSESSITTREGGAAGLTLPIPSLSAQLPPASLAASAVMVQEDMTPEEGEDGPTCEVFDIEDDSSESPSPESDVTSLRIKLKEAQYKNAVAEAELAKAKTKVTVLESMDTEREDYEKKLQSLSVRLVDVERALEAAKKDVLTYQDMLVESQGQYIILEKKYYKAKKLIKEFQQRERDFLHREEYHVQQLQEKDQEYNALVKSLKDRVIQLEQDLMETQRAVGLPVKLPYDNTTIKQLQLTPQQMRKPQGHNQAANMNIKSLETDISDCELSDADLAKYDLSPDSDDTEKTSTVERKPTGNTDPFEKAVPQTELLDSTAAKAKAELATKGSLANRQPPSLKKGSSTGSSGSGTPPTDRKLSDGNVSLGSSREDLDDSQMPPVSQLLPEDSPQHFGTDSPTSPVIEEHQIRRDVMYNGATIVTAASTIPTNTTITQKMLTTSAVERIAEVSETRTASSLKIDQGFANELKVVLSRVNPEARKIYGDGSASGVDDNATRNAVDNLRHSTPSPSSATSSSSSNFAETGEAPPKMIEVPSKRSSQIETGSPVLGKSPTSTRGPPAPFCCCLPGAGLVADQSADPVTGEVIHITQRSKTPSGETPTESGTGSTGSNSGERRPYQWQSCSVTDWSSAQVGQWLLAHNLEQYIPAFIDGNVNGKELLQMDSTKLKSLGVSSSSDRSALKKKVKELKSLFEKERKAAEKEQKQREKHLKKTEKASKKK